MCVSKNRIKRTPKGSQFLLMGIIGLHITALLHGLLVLLNGLSFVETLGMMASFYPVWIVFTIQGLVMIRKEAKTKTLT